VRSQRRQTAPFSRRGRLSGSRAWPAATVRKHLVGWITIGLYAINSQSQRCKWIDIDADYDHAFFDLGKLKAELELDGVSAAL